MDPRLIERGAVVGGLLRERGETVAVAEGSCGGLVSAALLSMPGASGHMRGGAVIYTRAALDGFLGDAVPRPDRLRGASEPFARLLAESARIVLASDWGLGEGGAAGPDGNPYGDPAGHAWFAVDGPTVATRHLLTGSNDRVANMTTFALEALDLLESGLRDAP
ncbi:MAG: CinA family protein [Actinomycetota bacterium]